ncbi:hypothetical protein B0H19DRAFT_1272119 [Mycena capillaripes]|nr:hypothetical protein B0H19DRAFT_1272119 [Mycena capillaripes]
MSDPAHNLTTGPTPKQEMGALVAQLAALTRLGLDMTRLCIDINETVPRIVQAQVEARVQAIEWHVVCIGRRPGLYATPQEADDQVRGVPKQSWKKKDNCQEALLYYRTQHTLGEVMQVSEVPPPA